MLKGLSKDRFKSRGVEKPVPPSTSCPEKPSAPEIEQIIIDPSGTGKRYQRGKFLGKGGFAKCYELIDLDTQEIYAGKIVAKSLLSKPHQREKMSMEISIHRSLSHVNIVGFHSFFEDNNFVYVILELCRRRSMMELHKRRKALTEPEVRYYMKQILEACCFLHGKNIIHRDLKLGNLFLNDEMQVKIGDFGLATKVDYEGERKKTLCGTPNYIAPEVLSKKGHSFEVDVWSVGCILYTLLVGKPPFETASLKETYMRIKKNEYYIPSRVSHTAQMLIIKMLRPDPSTRPRMQEVLDDAFFRSGYLPLKLHVSCLTMVPRFPSASQLPSTTSSSMSRKPLLELNSRNDRAGPLGNIPEGRKFDDNNVSRALCVKDGIGHDAPDEKEMESEAEPEDCYLGELHKQITTVLASRPLDKGNADMDDIEDPASTPIYWVAKWVDYSDKYGLGYQLNDGSVGVLFNDSTRLLMNEDGETLQYIDRENKESFHTMRRHPEHLKKKKTLLEYFTNYMHEHLLKAGGNVDLPKVIETARLPFLRTWLRTRSAIVLHLSCGILQVNFFHDHVKIFLCPKMGAVTYIDEKKQFRTFKLSSIEQNGCCQDLCNRLKYARTMIEKMQAAKGRPSHK